MKAPVVNYLCFVLVNGLELNHNPLQLQLVSYSLFTTVIFSLHSIFQEFLDIWFVIQRCATTIRLEGETFTGNRSIKSEVTILL